MFGLFKFKKSPIRQTLEQSSGVRQTWFEWIIENETIEAELIVESNFELDPKHPEFHRDGIEEIREIVRGFDAPVPKVRIIPPRSRD